MNARKVVSFGPRRPVRERGLRARKALRTKCSSGLLQRLKRVIFLGNLQNSFCYFDKMTSLSREAHRGEYKDNLVQGHYDAALSLAASLDAVLVGPGGENAENGLATTTSCPPGGTAPRSLFARNFNTPPHASTEPPQADTDAPPSCPAVDPPPPCHVTHASSPSHSSSSVPSGFISTASKDSATDSNVHSSFRGTVA